MDQHFFQTAFALNGDKTAIPEPTQGGGEVSYEQGFGPDYSLPNANPSRKKVPRQESNELYFNITENLQDYQTHGLPQWITAADNGGVAYPYDKWAMCRHTDGSEVVNWISLVTANDVEPGTDPTKWAKAATILQPAGSYSGIVAVTSTPYVVLAADVGKLHTLSGAAADITMPAIAGLEIGNSYTFKNDLTTRVLINRDGASTFAGLSKGTTSFYLAAKSTCVITKKTASVWEVSGISSDWIQVTGETAMAGTEVEITDIPAGIKMLRGIAREVSLDSADGFSLLLGGAAYAVAGYKGQSDIPTQVASAWSTQANMTSVNFGAASTVSFHFVLFRWGNTNRWHISGFLGTDDGLTTATNLFQGSVLLPDDLAKIKIKTNGGVAAFDGGVLELDYSGKP